MTNSAKKCVKQNDDKKMEIVRYYSGEHTRSQAEAAKQSIPLAAENILRANYDPALSLNLSLRFYSDSASREVGFKIFQTSYRKDFSLAKQSIRDLALDAIARSCQCKREVIAQIVLQRSRKHQELYFQQKTQYSLDLKGQQKMVSPARAQLSQLALRDRTNTAATEIQNRVQRAREEWRAKEVDTLMIGALFRKGFLSVMWIEENPQIESIDAPAGDCNLSKVGNLLEPPLARAIDLWYQRRNMEINFCLKEDDLKISYREHIKVRQGSEGNISYF